MLAALGFSAVLLLAVWGRRARAALVAVGLLIGWGISEVAKAVVGRPRPPVDDALIAMPSSGSMPSGHALTTLVFLGLLVYVAFAVAPGRAAGRAVGGACGGRSQPRSSPGSSGCRGSTWVSTGCPTCWAAGVLGGAWLLVFLSGIWRYLRARPCVRGGRIRGCPRLVRRAHGVAVRIAAVVFVVILCVAAYILTAHADPLLADL